VSATIQGVKKLSGGATVTVAASDSSVMDKAQATFVCTGTTDETLIAAAYATLAAGGSLRIAPGTYTLTSAGLTFATAYTTVFCEGEATFNTAADIDAVTVSAQYIKLHNLYINSSVASTKAGLKLVDDASTGAKHCEFRSIFISGFEYNLQLLSANAAPGGVAYNMFDHISCWSGEGSDLYIDTTGSGWCNANYFRNCDVHSAPTSSNINIDCDCSQNEFWGCTLEGGTAGVFSVTDKGKNVFIGCSFETAGAGLMVQNASATIGSVTRVSDCQWIQVVGPTICVEDGYAYVSGQDGFTGYMREDEGSARKTTHVESESSGTTLNVHTGDGASIFKGDVLLINSGGGSEEYVQVSSVATDAITTTTTMRSTHNAAEAVVTVGYRSGIDYRPSDSTTSIFTYGYKPVTITGSTGLFATTQLSSTASTKCTANVGAAGTSVTATEYGDGHNHFTYLATGYITDAYTFADNASLGVGYLAYTFPSGAIVVESAYMTVRILAASTEIKTDTPDVGIGTAVATGDISVLSSIAASENILTGQTMANCNGNWKTVTVANQPLAIASGDAHTVYVNCANGWADDTGGDLTANLNFEIALVWKYMGNT
jgi:hypothetical protein